MKFILFCFTLLLSFAYGQDFRAHIQGTVTDPTGSAVAGAKITVTSIDRGTITEAETNASGLYVVQGLLPGKYKLTAEKAGFKTVARDSLTLIAADRASVDISLTVGAIADSVTVTSDIPLLQTETALRSTTIENRIIEDLPTNGRNLYQLQYTLPGVVKSSRYMGSMELYAFGNINGVTIAGGRSGENETVIDGVTNTRSNRGVAIAPALNATQEVTIQTNSYDAQFGRLGGGVTSISIKSGTNDFHGQLFEFLKNDKLNGNDWIANKNGEPRSTMRNNTFGFEFDGPILIPKLFNGRNRMFFMLSLERLQETVTSGEIRTLPTEQELRGDFSRLPITIYNPFSTTLGSDGRYTRTPFAGNIIPGDRINPIASKAASLYPKPTRAGDSALHEDNYGHFEPGRNWYNAWLGKMDYRFGSNSSFAFRYGETPWYNYSKIVWGNNAAEPSGEYPSTRVGRTWGFDYTYTASPTMVLNLRGGLSRYEGFTGNTFGQDYDPRQLGFSSSLVSQFGRLRFPRFNIDGYSELGAATVTSYEAHDTYSLQPNLTMIRGRHIVKAGAEFRRYNSNNINAGYSTGLYAFTKGWTQADPTRADAQSGNGFASFLLGYPQSGQVDRNIDTAYRNHYFAGYVQDDFKATSRLTFNFGFRWDYEQPFAERYNRMVRGFAFGQPSPIQAQVQGLSLQGGLLYAGSGGDSRFAFNPSHKQFQPRVGVAWRFRDKWVMRGGYGLAYLGQSTAGGAVGFSRTTALVASTDGNITPAASLSDPFPVSIYSSGLLQPIGNSQGLATNLGQTINAQYLDRPLPYSQQFSFGFQRQIRTWLADVSYVGNVTRRLPLTVAQNFLPANVLESLPLDQRAGYFTGSVPNPMAGLLPGSGINGATVPRQQLLYKFPQYTQVNITDVPFGRQDYHSLQASITRRFASGFIVNANYTFSKTLEAVSLLAQQDADLGSLTRSRLEKRLVDYDIPHKFSFTGSYDLPIGKGRRYASGMHPIVNGFLGNWAISGQWIRQSGFIMAFPNAGNLEARSAKLSDSQRNDLARAAGRDRWDVSYDKYFDVTLFPKQAKSAFEIQRFPTKFPDVRAQGVNEFELSAYKNIPIKERLRLQIRADFQNAFNHPWFGQPVTTSVTDPRFGQLLADQNNEPRRVVAVMKLLF